MKSEKAKEFIDGCISNLTAELADHAIWQIRTAMTHVADLAEQEAEERIGEKALEAFCSECTCYETGVCVLGPDRCATKLLFIQKLNENEND